MCCLIRHKITSFFLKLYQRDTIKRLSSLLDILASTKIDTNTWQNEFHLTLKKYRPTDTAVIEKQDRETISVV